VSEFSTAGIASALDRTSDDIKREVGSLIPAAAQGMADTLKARYPVGAHHRDASVPHMKDDIFIRTRQSQDARLPVRKVIGPHLAYIWQNGTKARTDPTRKNAKRGRMPVGDRDFFERTAARTRAEMMARAEAVLARARQIG
jgi:hypothetical protein